MASSVQFLERWRSLADPKTTANERAGNYTVLTSYLKEGGLNPSFSKELCRHQQPLLRRILRDVTCTSCDHAALQVLGYCLHNIEFASKFNKEQVNSTIKGLQEVITNGSTEKSACTRALWCLTNQQLPVDHMTSQVTNIITMATEVVTVHQVGVATVSSEALNVLVRFGQQFPVTFAKLTPTWYKAIVELIICKVNKVQLKALSLAVSYEAQLQASHEVTHWLTKILKERVVSVMLAQLTERGQDHVHVLKSWAHFVSVLGKTLHKHGSFLNELLRVVETGFKHRSPQVQIAAYDAWKTLITNFSLDLNVMTSSKRLKLLMMPLLASAVRERHDTVEQARIQTWWHLIDRLGSRRASQFQQVCVPFLLLCLGLDPKSDISQLPDSISDIQSHSHSSTSDSKSSTDSNNAQTPKSSSTMSLAVTPTPTASSSGAPPISATPISSHKHGRLLSTINTPRSRGGMEIEKAKKSSDRYQTPPTVAMVMTGCHALLEFTGSRDEFPHSLIKSDPGVCVVFPKLIVPMETAHFMLLFLDALLTYATQLEFKEKGISLDLILHHIVTVLISSIEAEDGVNSTVPASVSLLVAPLVDLLHSGSLTEHLGRQMRMDTLSQLSSLSPRLLLTVGGGRGAPSNCWKKLTFELLRASKPEQTSDWFSRNWLKLTKMIPSTSMPLGNVLFLSNELSRLVKEGSMEREICSTLWTSLAKELTSFIAQTSQINNGTSVEPNFESLCQILKFPFLHLLDNGERSHVTSVMDVWKSLYETANIHMGLVVKETNLCAELVCSDLYAAYGQYMKQVPSSLDQRHQVLRFDLYQNAVASALSYVISKIKWGTLAAPATGGQPSKERGGGKVKSLETLLSLLAWQLAAFWDTAKKGPMQLSQLTTPYTLLDIVESLYHHVTSSALIIMATEMIGQPLATLFEAILNNSSSQPSTGRSRMTQQDIEHHVEKVWKSITICFQSRHTHPFDSTLLSTLSPLLVATLNSSNRQLSNLAMSFWAVTFDKAQTLDYPTRLRDYFVKYLKDLKQPTELKLPSLNGSTLTLTSAQKELIATGDSSQLGQSEVIHFSDTQSHSQSKNQDSDVLMVDLVDVVLPNPSPRKKEVCGSFLNRPPAAASSPLKPRPGPSSPLAKQLDEILARSATTMEKVQSSPLKGVGAADRKAAGSPLASARRRLDLGSDKEDYVSVGPPIVKKRRLLTEHQEEVMRERRADLPTLYNALDPTLDSVPITMATQDQATQQSNEADPIVISESEYHLPPASSSDGPTSVPDSIPIPHSRLPVSPTSRDAPITISDSPPPTPPTSSQQSITMATTAPSSASSKNVNITIQSSVNSSSVGEASVNPLPVVTTVSLDKILEMNQSLIDATAQLCAKTTLAITGNTMLPSQPPPPKPPSLKSISNQAPHISMTSTTSQAIASPCVTIAQPKSIPPAAEVISHAQSVSVAQATSVQVSSTAAISTVQNKATISSSQVQVASSESAAMVQTHGGQMGSISTATALARSGPVSISQSLPSPTVTTTAATANNSVIKLSSSRTIPGSSGFLQPASLTNPKMQVLGTLGNAVYETNLAPSNSSVAAWSASTHRNGVAVTNSNAKQCGTVSTSLPESQNTVSASRNPQAVASSFDQPYAPSSTTNNFPYLFSAPIIISQTGQRGVVPFVQPTAPHSVHVQHPAVGQGVQVRVLPPRGPGIPTGTRGVFGLSTLPGHVMSTGVAMPGRVMSTGVDVHVAGHGIPTGVGQAAPKVFSQVIQPRVIGARAAGQNLMVPPVVIPPPRVIQGTAQRSFLPPAPGARILPGIPPAGPGGQGVIPPQLIKQGIPPPPQTRMSVLLPRPPQLVTQGVQGGAASQVSQGVQVGVSRVISQNVPSITTSDLAKTSSSESVVTEGVQGSLHTYPEALGHKIVKVTTPQAPQKKAAVIGEEKEKEPEVKKRGRPRKVNRQEEREKDVNGMTTVIKRGRGRPRKESHDLVYEESAPNNQGRDGKEDEPRRSSRKRKLMSDTTSSATLSTNEIAGSDLHVVQGKETVSVATLSMRPASEQVTTAEAPTNDLPSSNPANSIPTHTTSVITSSSTSVSSSSNTTSAEKGEKSTVESGTNTEKVTKPENAKIEQKTEQNVRLTDDNMETGAEEDLTATSDLHVAEDSEDPLCGLKSKRRREEEEEEEEDREREGTGEEGMETQSRMEEQEEAEGRGEPASPELISSETEISGDYGKEMDSERHDSSDISDKSERRENKSDPDSTGAKSESDETQMSGSKHTTASVAQTTEQSTTTMTDGTAKSVTSADLTTTSSRESSGGRKSLSLRRHSTGSSTSSDSVKCDGVSGEGGTSEEVGGGEREETAAGGTKKMSLVDTPTNGKGGILKHTSQFDTPSTAKAGRRVQFATKPVFHEPQSQQVKQQEEPAKPVTPKQSRGSRTTSGSFSSRRTLMMSQTPPKMILVNKPHPPATPPQSSGPVYPSLKDCQSPVEQILPALSPSSKFTHGLLQLVSAQNITTVGNISSLSEHEVQTLPIKSPKVLTLRSALRSFEQQLQGSKRKSSIDSEASVATPPPRKQPRLDSDVSSSSLSSSTTTKDGAAKQEKSIKSNQREESTGSKGTSDESLQEKEDSLNSKDARSQEAQELRSLEANDAGNQKAEDVQSVKSQEAKDLRPQEAIDVADQEVEELRSQEAEEDPSYKMDSDSAGHPPDEQEVVKASHEEEPGSQEAESMDSEELSEGTCDMNTAIITLCTPESQLTPHDDTNDTDDQREQDTDTSENAQEENTDGERMDIDGDRSKIAHLESPPLTPPSSEADLQPQALSISHDHSYCSQTNDDNLLPSAPLTREEKVDNIEDDKESGASNTVVSVMVHDHTYCSQQAAEESADSAKPKAKTGVERAVDSRESRDRDNISSKLSLTVHDHTYCSNFWPVPEEERNDVTCLMETSPTKCKHHQEEDGALALAKESGDRETSPTAMDGEEGAMMEDKEPTREEKEMEADMMTDEAAPTQMDLDADGDSDVFTDEEKEEGESELISSSSQSQELFSQQSSQDEQLAQTREDTSTRAESNSVLPKSHGDQGVEIDESEDITVAKGDDADHEGSSMDKGVPAVTKEGLKTDRESRADVEIQGGRQGQEISEVVKEGQSASALGAANIKGQDQPTTAIHSGSADSSDSSSIHTYNAECSERPASSPLSGSTHDHTSNQPASSSLESTSSEKDSSSRFLNMLSQVRDLHDHLHKQLDERSSLSQPELLACLETLNKVTRTATKFSEALVRNTKSQSNQQDAVL